ncbi:MAG: hypothetical protein NXH85_15890 [Pseudomonadaceae bacterium]|nr:hypothetical protein [Pseudomonadaceae bacterium]
MGGIAMGLALLFVYLAIVSFVVHWIWNSTIADVFDLRQVTHFEAAKITLLSLILFGGVSCGSLSFPRTWDSDLSGRGVVSQVIEPSSAASRTNQDESKC